MTRARLHDGIALFAANDLQTNRNLKRLIAGLNRLAEAQFAGQARGETGEGRALAASDLAAFGLACEDCRELVSRGLLVPGDASGSTRLDQARPALSPAPHRGRPPAFAEGDSSRRA